MACSIATPQAQQSMKYCLMNLQHVANSGMDHYHSLPWPWQVFFNHHRTANYGGGGGGGGGGFNPKAPLPLLLDPWDRHANLMSHRGGHNHPWPILTLSWSHDEKALTINCNNYHGRMWKCQIIVNRDIIPEVFFSVLNLTRAYERNWTELKWLHYGIWMLPVLMSFFITVAAGGHQTCSDQSTIANSS